MSKKEDGNKNEDAKKTEKLDKDIPYGGPPAQMICNSGQVIVHQGTPAHQAFYIETGRVEVSLKEGDTVVKIAELGPGEIFGEIGVIAEEERMASVTAIEKSTLRIIPGKELAEKIKSVDDKFIKSLIDTLVRRLRHSNSGQMRHYKNMALFQDRMAGLAHAAANGVDQSRREEFSAEVSPLLEQIETVMKRYRK